MTNHVIKFWMSGTTTATIRALALLLGKDGQGEYGNAGNVVLVIRVSYVFRKLCRSSRGHTVVHLKTIGY